MSFTNSQYINWIDRCAAALAAAQDELTALDTAIGDGDHGLNMHRGFSKAQEKLAAECKAAKSSALFGGNVCTTTSAARRYFLH